MILTHPPVRLRRSFMRRILALLALLVMVGAVAVYVATPPPAPAKHHQRQQQLVPALPPHVGPYVIKEHR